jgi:EAL domain-containing protein (putative c-di-GMP-specific phosphodiesterase class I)/FixJ family two-component response regulator
MVMKRILIVEDNPDISSLTKDLLELEGFEVAIADNGREGVALARQQQPDLVLCDIMLPELDGYGVLMALRQHPASAMIPFIFLTAKAGKADLRRGMQLGADDYLTKPFTSQELLDAIAIRLAKQAAVQKFYTQSSSLFSTGQQELVENLNQAIERSEFVLYYQPQIDLKTKTIIGVESLIRWRHAERGLISPVEFIPLAEQTGLIVPIGVWVLQTACQQAKVWQAHGFPPLRIAVNLSACQFSQPTLPDTVIQILQETGLDPQWLDLELTESTLMQDAETSAAMLNKLKALGMHISIDDFGTGYSSLSYLERFSFDFLKIDRKFVKNAATNPKSAAIAIAVIQMAHRLQLQVIAEGVETPAELAFLNQHGCDVAQGYWFSKPVPALELGQLLNTMN